MSRKTLWFITLFVLVLSLAACNASAPQTVTVTEQNAGEQVALNVGDTLVITLPGNPTTGYAWEVSESDDAIMKQVGEPAFTPDTSAIGSPGLVSLSFEVVGAGQTPLQLIYHRSFEPDTPPAQTFEITVVVK